MRFDVGWYQRSVIVLRKKTTIIIKNANLKKCYFLHTPEHKICTEKNDK